MQLVMTNQDHERVCAYEWHLNLQQALRIGPCDRISGCAHNKVVALDASVQWHVSMHHAVGDEWGVHEQGVTFRNECDSKQLGSDHPTGTHMVASLCDRTSCGADTMPRSRLEGEGGEMICKAEDVRAGCMTDRSCGC